MNFTEPQRQEIKDIVNGELAAGIPVATDPAVWLGNENGSEFYKWGRKKGDPGPPVVVKARRSPVKFQDGQPRKTAEELKVYADWRTEVGIGPLDVSSGFAANNQHETDWQQAKEAIYKRETGYSWMDTAPGGSGSLGVGFESPEQPGIEHPDAAGAGGGATSGSTEVKSGMGGGFVGGGKQP